MDEDGEEEEEEEQFEYWMVAEGYKQAMQQPEEDSDQWWNAEIKVLLTVWCHESRDWIVEYELGDLHIEVATPGHADVLALLVFLAPLLSVFGPARSMDGALRGVGAALASVVHELRVASAGHHD